MVNSPSHPNSRPIDPPAPVDCGGLTPLCHRETSLPVQRTGRLTPPAIKPNQTKSNQSTCREFCVTLPISHQSRQKPQQSRLIVPNQASSRQTMNFLMVLPPPVAIFNLAFGLQHLAFYPQTPVIVPHQGISRHPPKNTRPLGTSPELGGWHLIFPRPLHFATWRLRAFALKTGTQSRSKAQSRQKPLQSCIIKAYQGKRQISRADPSRAQQRPNLPLAPLWLPPAPAIRIPKPPIKAETPVIVLNQASSRQTPKFTRPLGRLVLWSFPSTAGHHPMTVPVRKTLLRGGGLGKRWPLHGHTTTHHPHWGRQPRRLPAWGKPLDRVSWGQTYGATPALTPALSPEERGERLPRFDSVKRMDGSHV